MKISPYHQKAYGQWAGNSKGTPADPERCAKEVFCGFHSYQCSRKRGYGPDNAFCKQHASKI